MNLISLPARAIAAAALFACLATVPALAQQSASSNAAPAMSMQHDDGAAMKHDGMQGGAMMKHDAMQGGAMMKGDGMKGGAMKHAAGANGAMQGEPTKPQDAGGR